MPKATTFSNGVDYDSHSSEQIVKIQESLQTLGQSMHQVRSHELLLQEAGVRLDKAGIALLFKLERHGDSPLRVTDLAELLGVDSPTVTRKVQQLERLGFVTREADAEDGRATRIQLTQAGRDTLERVLTAHRARLARQFEEWSDRDVKTFAHLLERFSTTLRMEMEQYRD